MRCFCLFWLVHRKINLSIFSPGVTRHFSTVNCSHRLKATCTFNATWYISLIFLSFYLFYASRRRHCKLLFSANQIFHSTWRTFPKLFVDIISFFQEEFTNIFPNSTSCSTLNCCYSATYPLFRRNGYKGVVLRTRAICI